MTGNQIAYWKYAEDVRHNAETESQGRLNLSETARHNLASEGLQSRQIGLGYAQLAETRRANQARELIQSEQLKETRRTNIQKEFETFRSNKAREEEISRSNKVAEEETERHNRRQEQLKQGEIEYKHGEFEDQLELAKEQFEFDKDYKTKVQTYIEIGKALTNLVGSGAKLITAGS